MFKQHIILDHKQFLKINIIYVFMRVSLQNKTFHKKKYLCTQQKTSGRERERERA
jgi:hypothetical protein